MPNYVRAANPIWYFVDLTGLSLNDQYFIFFLKNTDPTVFQLVYQDNQGLTPWSNPLIFYPNGTLPDNLYFEDDEVYRIEIRKGPTQSDPLIYVINNFKPDNGSSGNSGSAIQQNQISNPQFAFVDFTIQPAIDAVNKSLSITTAGVYPIGPDWFLTLTGTGSATVRQIVSTGEENVPSNPVPPYSLKITTNGWDTAILSQRFNGNAAIWANTFVSMSILARSDDGTAYPITLNYAPQAPGTTRPIVSGVPVSTGSFELIQGISPLPQSTNTNPNSTSYVDMQIVLPNSGSIEFSNVQVMGQNTNTVGSLITLPDETINRQLDKEFHYYANSLIIQPKASILTGWDFPLNPWQNPPAAPTIASQCTYITDQTILYQKTASSVAVGKQGAAMNEALVVEAVLATNQFALIQYIDPSSVRPYWGKILSSLVHASKFTGSPPTVMKIKMRLIWRTTLPPTLSAVEPIASLDTNGDPVFAAGWTPIKPINDIAYPLTSTLDYYPFEGFQLPAGTTDTMTLGIVIYSTSDMSTTAPDIYIFDSISLVPNEFAIETNPLTFDETLRNCEFYYEKSYDTADVPGTAARQEGQHMVWQNVILNTGAYNFFASPFDIQFKTVKRADNAVVTLYNPVSGTINNVDAMYYINGAVNSPTAVASSNWDRIITGMKSTQYVPNTGANLFSSTATGSLAGMGILKFHCTIDSRMGV